MDKVEKVLPIRAGTMPNDPPNSNGVVHLTMTPAPAPAKVPCRRLSEGDEGCCLKCTNGDRD